MVFWPSADESRRLREIAHVLFENHLGHIIVKLGLKRKLPFEKRIVGERFKKKELTPQIVLKIFEELGGSFVKLGQLLSLRPDLIPAEYCDELSKLQDKVKPFPGKEAKEIIEKELGKPVNRLFSEFHEMPVAAASMGQVHTAKLKDGTRVAVKVQRPSIYKTVKTDIKLLYRLAGIVRKRYGTKYIDPVEIVREFERYTENEMNYLKEAHHIDLFYHNFAKSKTIVIPQVFWSHTTSKVLTMEYVAGKRLTDMSRFKPAERKQIFKKILEAQFEQVFVHGLFHADPHPGNYLIKRNGKIALLDFGIVGRLDYVLKENITDFFVSMVNADVDGMVHGAMRIGVAPEGTDTEKIKRDVYDHLSAYYGRSMLEIRISEALNDIIKMFRKNDLKISPNFTLLVKMIITLEGLGQNLDPKVNFIELSRPFVRSVARKRLHPREIAERAKRKVEMMLEFAESIPKKTSALLSELHDTDRDLRRIDKDISSLTVEMNRSSNRVTLGFLAGTLFIASTMLLPFQVVTFFGVPALSFIGYIIALIVLLAIFVSILKEKKI